MCIKNIDTSEAEKLPGVKAIITAKDVPSMRFGLSPARFDENIFCIEKVRYNGDKIGAICAVDEETVYKALKLIKVEYEELPAVFTVEDAKKEGAPQIFEEYPGNLNTEIHHKFGDPDEAIKNAYYVRTDVFQGQRTYHAFIENHCSSPIGVRYATLIAPASQFTPSVITWPVLGMKMGDLRVQRPMWAQVLEEN